MSSPTVRSGSALARRLAFFKGLQSLNTRVHDTSNIDEIIFDVSTEVCALFGAERMTIYVVDETGNTISSRVKTGLHVAKSIRLPISDKSVAGFCAQHRRMLNIRNVYDEKELQQITDRYTSQVDEMVKHKEAELLEV